MKHTHTPQSIDNPASEKTPSRSSKRLFITFVIKSPSSSLNDDLYQREKEKMSAGWDGRGEKSRAALG